MASGPSMTWGRIRIGTKALAESEEADFEGIFHDWSALLDAIELALNNEEFPRAYELVKGRFEIVVKHGLTVEWTGMPVSGSKN